MIKGIKWHSNSSNENSLANRFRKKRMDIFEKFLEENYGEKLKRGKKITVLDVGGSYRYWGSIKCKYFNNLDITLINIEPLEIPKELEKVTNIKSVNGDGTNLIGIKNNQFDVVFSNSCIEHVGSYELCRLMALEIERVGEHYFVQTPNRFFPIEPHYLFPFFQLFPVFIKAFLINHYQLGNVPRQTTKEQARAVAKRVNLLSKNDLKTLFPGAIIKCERLFGLVKSFMVYK